MRIMQVSCNEQKKPYTAKVVSVGTKLVKDGDQQVKIHKRCIKNCADVFVVQEKKEVGLRSNKEFCVQVFHIRGCVHCMACRRSTS